MGFTRYTTIARYADLSYLSLSYKVTGVSIAVALLSLLHTVSRSSSASHRSKIRASELPVWGCIHRAVWLHVLRGLLHGRLALYAQLYRTASLQLATLHSQRLLPLNLVRSLFTFAKNPPLLRRQSSSD